MRNFIQIKLFLSISVLYTIAESKDIEVDPNGYLVYCPCMGKSINFSRY